MDDQTVAQIKEWAQHDARTAGRGASAISLIKTARTQLASARETESAGELKSALSMYYKAASLMQMYMATGEFRQEEGGKKGVLTKEFIEFQKYDGRNLDQRTRDLESRVLEMESANGANGVEADGPVQKSGGSIADRMRSLQNAGLAVNTTSKRISRELPKAPMSPPAPMSPKTARSAQGLSIQTLSPSTSQQSTSTSPLIPSSVTSPVQPSNFGSPVISSSGLYNASQAFVAPSTLGPPSPTSSSSSSPRVSTFNIDSFQQQFPSIDELDELQGLQIATAPTATGSSSSSGRLDDGIPALPNGITPKTFPVLPMDTGPQRVTSASGLTNLETFISRPSSPAGHSPTLRASPIMPRKPSALGLNQGSPLPGRSPRLGNNSPQLSKPDLPVTNTIPPVMLHEYMQHPGIQVLLLDLRARAEFEQEHIKSNEVICLEPMVLGRDSVTAEMIEDSLSIAPRGERLLFSNRDKFDLVVMYDNESASYGASGTPFMSLERAIYEKAFRKMLKKMPVLLVGGLQAWKRDLGEEAVARGDKAEGSGLVLAHSSNGVNGAGIVNGVAVTPEFQHPPAHARDAAQSNPHSVIMSRSRSNTDTIIKAPTPKHQYRQSVDQQAMAGPSVHRRPALSRPPSTQLQRPMIPEHTPQMPIPSAVPSSIQYPTFRPRSPSVSAPSSRPRSPSVSSSSPFGAREHFGLVSPPPQASINPSPLSRRRSDFVDQSQEALSGSGLGRAPIDYPDLSAHHQVLRPPPAVASSSLGERQDARPQRVMQPPAPSPMPGGPRAPTIPSDYPVPYWGEAQLSPSGLKNMGNTCYMNSTIQCLNATMPFARFFIEGRWQPAVNMVNPLGTKGAVAAGFATLLRDLNQGAVAYLTPLAFRRTFINHANQFDGTDQQDCQEFLSTLLDSLHEDLNRILHKPTYQPTPEREEELERIPQPIASEQEWHVYRMRNDSLVVDFFQGQYRSRLECMTCHKTSTTYNAFMYLTLPIPTGRLTKVTIQQCLDTFVKEEIMEKSDAWNCPHCKALRRATKRLTLSRLPPILLIHLKRFSSKGTSTDKIETFVDFPLKGLDLTSYMPPPLPPGADNGFSGQQLPMDDPRRQAPPFKYDLYAVTNHFGNLSSGHYTAHVASRGQWLYCDDSRVVPADAKDVVAKPAYVLFYKRVKA